MRLAARAVRGVANATLRAALVAAVAALIVLAVGPRTGTYRTVTVLTGSMRPMLEPGSVAIVVPRRVTDLRVGDVITFNAPVEGEPVVTHRVTSLVREGDASVMTTRGDANDAPDPWRARIEDATVWVVRASVPWAGRFIVALREPATRMVTVYGALALLALVWVRDIWRPRPSRTPAEA